MQGGKRLHKTQRPGLYYDEIKLRISCVYLRARFLSSLFGVIEISAWLGVGV